MKATQGFRGGAVYAPPPRRPDRFEEALLGSTLILIVSEVWQRTALVMKEAHPDPKWCIPGGGIKLGETVQEAAAREGTEETGIPIDPDEVTVLLAERRDRYRYSPHFAGVIVSEDAFDRRRPRTYDDGEWLKTREIPVNDLLGLRDLLNPHRKRLNEAFTMRAAA